MENHTPIGRIHLQNGWNFFPLSCPAFPAYGSGNTIVPVENCLLISWEGLAFGVVPLGSHEKKHLCLNHFSKNLRTFFKKQQPKIVVLLLLWSVHLLFTAKANIFQKNITNHLIKLTFQNGAFFPGKFRRWSLTTPLQRRVSPPNALVGSIWWMPNYTPVEHAKFSIWNKSDMFLDVFLDVGGSVYH